MDLRKGSSLPHLFLNCPTGAGKSKAGLAILTHEEKNTQNLIIISAPQKEIGKGFLTTEGTPQNILGHTWMINPMNQLCENSYKNEDGNISRVLEVLKSPRSKDLNERILICCHATLALMFDRMSSSDKSKYFKDIKLCIDESHHSLSQEDTGNGLGKVVNYFLKHEDKNLGLIMMTATPFRGDKGSLIPEKYLEKFCRYELNYGRHFEENCDGLEFTYNAVLHQYGDCYGKVIKDLMDKHLDQNDKVLIQIPPSNRSISNGKFNDLQMMYDSIGKTQKVDDNGVVLIKRGKSWVKVLDLITEKNRSSRLDYLRKNPTETDVVIGIAMIKEGFDWPPANAGILIGSQGSLNAQIQIMGRMFRAFKNKGKNNGMKPVLISQIFPYVDHEKLDEDDVREQINTFMKVVYSALAMELVINPIHIDLPTKMDDKGEPKPRQSVKGFLTENLTDTQYTELMSSVMDDYRDWKANAGEDDKVSDKITEIVSQKLSELGIDENHKEVSEFFNKSLQRSAKFQIMALQGIDVSHIDIDLMDDIEDPIESILMGMSNGLCGANDIKSFQALMKPVDTLRRCYELKEWVEKNNENLPLTNSSNLEERRQSNFYYRMIGIKKGTRTDSVQSMDHIEILESIPNWSWGYDDTLMSSILTCKKWIVENGRYPQQRITIELSMYNILRKCKMIHRGTYKDRSCGLSESHIAELETFPNWEWNADDERETMKCENLKNWIIKNNRYPKQRSADKLERSMYNFVRSCVRSYRGECIEKVLKLKNDHIQILESIPNWKW